MTEILNRVYISLERYQTTYRHPDLPRFGISKLYALFPKEARFETEIHWDERWPNSECAGVYFIFGEGCLLYIGTAWKIGTRLSSYFQYEFPRNSKDCKTVDEWIDNEGNKCRPMYVLTVAVPDSSKFEAASLEEYLIQELTPSVNVIGRIRDQIAR